MIIEVPEIGLALRPYRGATCWQVFEWHTGRKDRDGAPLPDDWTAVDFYPSSLASGLRYLHEQAARRSSVRGTLAECMSEAESIRAAIYRAAERATGAATDG